MHNPRGPVRRSVEASLKVWVRIHLIMIYVSPVFFGMMQGLAILCHDRIFTSAKIIYFVPNKTPDLQSSLNFKLPRIVKKVEDQ